MFVDLNNPPKDPRTPEARAEMDEKVEIVEPVKEKPVEVEKEVESPKESKPEKKVVDEEEDEREFSDIEKEQMKVGWDPEGELSAEEYKARKPLYDEKQKLKKALKTQNKNISELKNIVREMSASMKKSEAKGYEKALADLQSQRAEAFDEGDAERFNKVDAEYQKAKLDYDRFTETLKAEPENSVDDVDPLVEDFKERNTWYGKTDSLKHINMTKDAVAFNEELVRLNPNITVEEELERTEEFIRDKYNDYFNPTNPNRSRPSTVSGSRPSRSHADEPTERDLSHFQKQIFSIMKEENPDITVGQYLDMSKKGTYTVKV